MDIFEPVGHLQETVLYVVPIFAHFYDALQVVLSNEKCLITHTQFVHRPLHSVYISHEF